MPKALNFATPRTAQFCNLYKLFACIDLIHSASECLFYFNESKDSQFTEFCIHINHNSAAEE